MRISGAVEISICAILNAPNLSCAILNAPNLSCTILNAPNFSCAIVKAATTCNQVQHQASDSTEWEDLSQYFDAGRTIHVPWRVSSIVFLMGMQDSEQLSWIVKRLKPQERTPNLRSVPTYARTHSPFIL